VAVPLSRRPAGPQHYEYNITVHELAGAGCALSAVAALLTQANPLLFHGRPRGVAHLPNILRTPFLGALIVGPAVVAIIYIGAVFGTLSDVTLNTLLRVAGVSSVLVFVLWLVGVASDRLVERRLARLLANSQIAWAFGHVVPRRGSRNEHSRNPIDVVGQSYAAALAMSTLKSLVNRLDGYSSWISWLIRRAAQDSSPNGKTSTKPHAITGKLSASGALLPVDELGKKKGICIAEGFDLLAPLQKDARPTAEERARGLIVRRCSSLSGLIWAAWAAARRGSGLYLWLGAIVALALIGFSIGSINLILPPPTLTLDSQQNPIIETADRRSQRLLLQFRTSCPECFVVRVHSRFWNSSGEVSFAEVANSDVAILSTELRILDNPVGTTLDGSVEILRRRHLPFLSLAPERVDEITFETLKDLHQRASESGKYASLNR
jgi:hypothetical protein